MNRGRATLRDAAFAGLAVLAVAELPLLMGMMFLYAIGGFPSVNEGQRAVLGVPPWLVLIAVWSVVALILGWLGGKAANHWRPGNAT
jgi:hypothetical protein